MRKRKEKKMKTVSLDVPVLTTGGDEIKRELRDDWSENPLATLENEEVREILSKAIDSLPEEHRTVLVLRGVNGFSNEEVAKMLEISLPAVKSRLHRARLFLRDTPRLRIVLLLVPAIIDNRRPNGPAFDFDDAAMLS